MPTPKIETGDAEQHRNPTPEAEEIEDIEEIEDVDDDLDLDLDDDPTPSGSSGGPLALLSNKKVLLGLLVAAAILFYLKHQSGGSGNSQRRSTVDDPADIASHLEGEPEHGLQIRQDRADPLVADEDVISQSGAFPSLQRGS